MSRVKDIRIQEYMIIIFVSVWIAHLSLATPIVFEEDFDYRTNKIFSLKGLDYELSKRLFPESVNIFYPIALTLSKKGVLYVLNGADDKIFRLKNGRLEEVYIPFSARNITAIYIDSENRLFLAYDRGTKVCYLKNNRKITIVNKRGYHKGYIDSVQDISCSTGDVLLAEELNDRISIFSDKGEFKKVIDKFILKKPPIILGRYFSQGEIFLNKIKQEANEYIRHILKVRKEKWEIEGLKIQFKLSKIPDKIISKFNAPAGIAVVPVAKRIYEIVIVDSLNDRVVILDQSGKLKRVFGYSGKTSGRFFMPKGVYVDILKNIYVADTGNNRIQKFSYKGEYLTNIGLSGEASVLNVPEDVVVKDDGTVYVADSLNGEVKVFIAEPFVQGRKAYLKEKYKEAVNYLKKALKVTPENPFAYYYLGYSYFKLGELKKSLKSYKQAYFLTKKQPYSRIHNFARQEIVRIKKLYTLQNILEGKSGFTDKY